MSTHQSILDALRNVLSLHALSTGNPHGVTKAQIGLADVTNLKDNLTAVVAPTANADSSLGYAVGSKWVDTLAKKSYTCVKATVGSAEWEALDNGLLPTVDQKAALAGTTGTPSATNKLVTTEDSRLVPQVIRVDRTLAAAVQIEPGDGVDVNAHFMFSPNDLGAAVVVRFGATMAMETTINGNDGIGTVKLKNVTDNELVTGTTLTTSTTAPGYYETADLLIGPEAGKIKPAGKIYALQTEVMQGVQKLILGSVVLVTKQ